MRRPGREGKVPAAPPPPDEGQVQVPIDQTHAAEATGIASEVVVVLARGLAPSVARAMKATPPRSRTSCAAWGWGGGASVERVECAQISHACVLAVLVGKASAEGGRVRRVAA